MTVWSIDGALKVWVDFFKWLLHGRYSRVFLFSWCAEYALLLFMRRRMKYFLIILVMGLGNRTSSLFLIACMECCHRFLSLYRYLVPVLVRYCTGLVLYLYRTSTAMTLNRTSQWNLFLDWLGQHFQLLLRQLNGRGGPSERVESWMLDTTSWQLLVLIIIDNAIHTNTPNWFTSKLTISDRASRCYFFPYTCGTKDKPQWQLALTIGFREIRRVKIKRN